MTDNCPLCRTWLEEHPPVHCPKCSKVIEQRASTTYGAAWALTPDIKHLRAGNLHAESFTCYDCNVTVNTKVHRHDTRKQRDETDGVLKPMETITEYIGPDFQTFKKYGPFAKA